MRYPTGVERSAGPLSDASDGERARRVHTPRPGAATAALSGSAGAPCAPLLTRAEAAAYLNVTERFIKRRVDLRRSEPHPIPVRILGSRTFRFDPVELDAWSTRRGT